MIYENGKSIEKSCIFNNLVFKKSLYHLRHSFTFEIFHRFYNKYDNFQRNNNNKTDIKVKNTKTATVFKNMLNDLPLLYTLKFEYCEMLRIYDLFSLLSKTVPVQRNLTELYLTMI